MLPFDMTNRATLTSVRSYFDLLPALKREVLRLLIE